MSVEPDRAGARRGRRAHDSTAAVAVTDPTAGARARATVQMREIHATPEGLARLGAFYRDAYVAEFPDPDERESLRNMRGYLSAKARGWYGPNSYHVVVAELDGRPIGGAVSDYLAAPNAGVVEFLFVVPDARGRGIGRALLDETLRLLRADARASDRGPLTAVVAEMNDPYRRSPTPDNLDPFERAVVWGRWGFAALGMRYVQPALSRGQRPVENLMLIARMLARPRTTRVPAAWALEVVAEYMRWAMRIPAPARHPQWRAMAAALGAQRHVELTPLQCYVGRDPQRPFEIDEIAAPGRKLRETLALLRRAIPHAGRVATAAQFRDALARSPSRARRYRLWSLRAPGAARIEGLASFFTLARCGFGGYVVLDGSLRGRGILPLLVARIEERMMRDGAGADGWFVECGDESLAPLRRAGFAPVGGDYRPPAVGADGNGGVERLHLLHKPFGQTADRPALSRAFVLDCVAAILRHVYRVSGPRRHACYRRFAASLEAAC